jgi:hypothetical protein
MVYTVQEEGSVCMCQLILHDLDIASKVEILVNAFRPSLNIDY